MSKMTIFKFLKYVTSLFFISTFILFAHGIAEEQIEHLTYHIDHFYDLEMSEEEAYEVLDKKQKDKTILNHALAMLYFERGQLYQERMLFDEAFNDYIFLLDVQHDLEIVNLTLAELLFEHDFFHLSLIYVNKFLEIQKNNINALECKAKTLQALGFYDESIIIYQNVISFALKNKNASKYLKPSHFIQLAAFFQERNLYYDNLSALKYLQLGIETFGNLASLEDTYIEVAISNKQYNEALVKIDEILAQNISARNTKYLLKKAEINLLFKCYEECLFFYQNAKHNMRQFSKRHISMNRQYFNDFHLLCNTNNFEIHF